MSSFTYLRHTFKPVGTLPENDTFFDTTRRCKGIGINNYDGGKYSHKKFYEIAEDAGCGETDLFEMDGSTLVLPCENELFEYTENI